MSKDPRRLSLVIIAIIGAAMAWSVADPTWTPDPSRALLHEMLPQLLRVWLWAVCSAVTLAGGVWPRAQGAAFTAAALMPLERSVSYVWSWLAWAVPGGQAGDPYAMAHAIVWGGVVALVVMLAGTVSPTKLAR